jgi:hypothetical protein
MVLYRYACYSSIPRQDFEQGPLQAWVSSWLKVWLSLSQSSQIDCFRVIQALFEHTLYIQ